MKVVILAGGLGTRLPEYTRLIPKPMVQIGRKPILRHIIDYYVSFGFKDFIIALGYKGNIIRKYFNKNKVKDANISLIDTGKNTLTGGRLKRLEKFLDGKFFLTYGDGLSDVNLSKLLKFHNKHKKLATVTAVKPIARFGELKIKREKVTNFKEKPNASEAGWINGGFFVIEKPFLKLIKNDKTILEKEPLEQASKRRQLVAFKHKKFWYCMDTKREKDVLENLLKSKKAPWIRRTR